METEDAIRKWRGVEPATLAQALAAVSGPLSGEEKAIVWLSSNWMIKEILSQTRRAALSETEQSQPEKD